MIDLIQNKLDDIVTACKKHHVETIALFGSAAKNVLHEDSDIDLLVEFSDDIILQRAVERDLEIIGEAIRKLK